MIFENGGATTDLYEISGELVRGLPGELSDPYAPDRPWTRAVTERLFEMGKARNLLVFCHGSPGREWLLDVVWMVEKERKIVFAVESEWGGPKPVEDDFDKLMSIKAQRKLLLFSTKNHKGADAIIGKLEANMRAYPYHLAGEEYMLLEVTAPGAFRYYFKVPSDGRQDDVTFEEVGNLLSWPWKP
jgi:hypothetical protein